MFKQLIIVCGAPYSGRTTWIKKNLLNEEGSILVDAESYPNLYVKSEKTNTLKLFEDTIDDSKTWCVNEVKKLMELETPPQRIVLSLIACRPDRWREFIELAIINEYQCVFRFPTNKTMFYTSKYNSTMEQFKFIESKVIHKYPKDKKEVNKKNGKGENDTILVETNESTLLRQIVLETESAYSFYLTFKNVFVNKEELLKKINEHYKTTILGDAKRAEKKIKDAEKEADRKTKEEEKQARKLAKEEEKLKKQQEKIVLEQTEQVEQVEQTEQV